MRVISFVTQKGGSGKTTLTFCCAVAAQEQGAKVLIIDMDSQGTAEAWYQDRESETPQLARVDAVNLAQAIDAAKRQGFDFVLLDTPGRDEPATAAAIRASDVCLIPCRPTPGDMKATPPTVATIQRLGKKGAFVLTQTPVRGTRLQEAAAGLTALGMVSPVRIALRHAYQDAQGRGLGVTEFERRGKAAAENPQALALDSHLPGVAHMTNRKRTSLDAVLGLHAGERQDEHFGVTEPPLQQPSTRRAGIKQQTAYLPHPVYEQLRKLAFEERRKMHDYILEGLDRVFRDRGLPSIAELTGKHGERV